MVNHKREKCPEGQRQIMVCLSDAEIKAIDDIQAKRHDRFGRNPYLCTVRRDLMCFAINCTNRQTGELPETIGQSTPEPALPQSAFADNNELFGMMDASTRYYMWAALPNNECIHINPLLARFTGHAREEFLGIGWTEALHREDVKRVCRLCREGFQSREPFPLLYRLRRADGLYGWIRDYAHPFYRPNWELGGYVGIGTVMFYERDFSTPQQSVIPILPS